MMMLDHHIEYSQQLPHTGCEHHFLGLGGPTKTLLKVPDHRMYRMATNAAMYRATRTCPRSPHALRFPRVPLPRLKGAAPTKAAISPRVRALSSGRPEGQGQDGPTPGSLWGNSSLSLRIREVRMKSPKSGSGSSSNLRMCS